MSPNLLSAPSRSERTWTRWVYGGVCLAAVLAVASWGRIRHETTAAQRRLEKHGNNTTTCRRRLCSGTSMRRRRWRRTHNKRRRQAQFGLDDAMSVCMPLVLLVVLVPIYRAQKDLSNVSETVQHLMKRQSLDNLVHERYSVMMAPLLRGSVCVACFAFVVPLASKVLATMRGSRSRCLKSHPRNLCRVHWHAFVAASNGRAGLRDGAPAHLPNVCVGADVLFRCQRIGDLLKAPDRVAFIRTTADVVGHDFSLPSVYSCLYLGYVMGLVRPTTLSGMVAFMLFGLVLPLAPPGLAYQGERRWLVAVLRSVTLPTTLGILIESMQQRLICHLLEKTICTELALALPDAPPPSIAADDGHAPFAPDSLNASFEALSSSFSRGRYPWGLGAAEAATATAKGRGTWEAQAFKPFREVRQRVLFLRKGVATRGGELGRTYSLRLRAGRSLASAARRRCA